MAFVTIHHILEHPLVSLEGQELRHNDPCRHSSSMPYHFNEPLSVLAVQFALVFALPALREVLPNPPIFGKHIRIYQPQISMESRFIGCGFGMST
jgi:hypothetical protein